MTKKEIVEKLKEKMPKITGNDEEKEIKTALYIYIELAKTKSFDERYYFGNRKLVKKAYSESIQDSKNPDTMVQKRRITCVSLSYLYKYVLNEFEIKSQVVKQNPEDEHVYTEIRLNNGNKIIADIQQDLYRIQTKSRIKYFDYFSIDHKEISQEMLTKMLIEIGYIEKEDEYRDIKIEKVRQKISGLDINDSLETILTSQEIIEGTENIGVVEADRYYHSVLKQLIPDKIAKDVFKFQCNKFQADKDEPKYTICIYSEEEEKKVQAYLFSEKNSKFLKCDLTTLDELQKRGLIFGKTGKENGIKKLKKYIESEKEKNEKEL